jgi:hypothetical protein
MLRLLRLLVGVCELLVLGLRLEVGSLGGCGVSEVSVHIGFAFFPFSSAAQSEPAAPHFFFGRVPF